MVNDGLELDIPMDILGWDVPLYTLNPELFSDSKLINLLCLLSGETAEMGNRF